MKRNSVLLLSGLLAAIPLTAVPNTAPDYVAHEWGTFTSVQGSDGELIFWNPFVESDLPEFVYTREKPCPMTPEQRQSLALQRLLLKSANHWLQRMETPVIYFHAREDFTVNVSVDFPKGLITEWYPAASAFGPASGYQMFTPDTKRSHLDWQQLRVLGRSANVTKVPAADGPSHYFTARTEGASPVRVQRGLIPAQVGEEERLLFYRGAGNFTTPLHARIDAHGDVVLENRSDEGLGRMFVFRQHDGVASFAEVPALQPGERRTVMISSWRTAETVEAAQASLAMMLEAALTETGLYPEESAAMVNTWRKDWLGDRGLRVLYLLPQSWTDVTLPLQLDPAPKSIVRVMVGRAEILEPAVEQKIQLALQRRMEGQPAETANDGRELLEPRFWEPALSRGSRLEIAARTTMLTARWREPALEEMIKEMTARVHGASSALQSEWTLALRTPPETPPQSRTVALIRPEVREAPIIP